MQGGQGVGGIILAIHLDRVGPESMQSQIYDHVKSMILTGQLAPGVRLPSTRVLSAEMRVARSTIAGAFDQLHAEGYIVSRVGAGTFVADVVPDLLLNAASQGPETQTRASSPLSKRGSAIEDSTGNPAVWPATFTPGMPAVMDFPFKVWSELLAEEWRAPGPGAFFGDIGGHWPLRENIAAYVGAARGIRCDADQVIVVSGTRQGTELTARALLDTGQTVIAENPGFLGVRSALIAAGLRVSPAPVDEEGLLSPARVPDCTYARMVSLAPSHQYPLGVTMTIARRREWLDWAARNQSWILEDDYDSEFRYREPPLPALQGLDRSERVIYVGTFSKTMFPSLRLGYLIVPKQLTASFSRIKLAIDGPTSLISQRAMSRFMDEGLFFRHIRKMRQLYAKRREALISALCTNIPQLVIPAQDEAGLFLMTRFADSQPSGRDIQIVDRARIHGLYPEALSSLYVGADAPQGLVFGFGGCGERQTTSAVETLKMLMKS